MERAMGIVVNHPASDDSDVARSYISLADTYVLTSNRRAKDLYLQAWEILSADPAHEELRYELFGRPKRLHPLKPIDMQIDHFPTGIEPGTKLFIDVEYAVYPNGRVRNIKVLETNISTAETKQFKYFVGEMRYRPRIIEGEIQTTEGLGMYQTFEVPNLQQAVSSTSSP
jgi:hypothetical protein